MNAEVPWITSSLEKVTSLIKDGSHGTHKDVDSGVPLLSAKDIRDGTLTIPADCRRIPEIDYELIHKNYSLLRDDILLTIVGSIGRRCQLTGNEPRFTIQRSVAVVRPGRVESAYLFHYFASESFQRQLEVLTNASAQGGVYLGSLAQCSITYPECRKEQSKIADILFIVDRAIEQTEALIAKQQRIETGLMQDLLTRGIDEKGNLRSEHTHAFKDSPLGRIPAEWRVSTLGETIGPITSGWSPTCESTPAAPGEWAILKTTAVVWRGYDQNENKRLPAHLHGVPSIEVRKDDILITRKGPLERVGVVVHVDDTRTQLMIPDTVFRMRVLNEDRILPAFLPLALGSRAIQADWFQKKIGLADAQVNLNHGILRATLFPEPSPTEQLAMISRAACMTHSIKDQVLQVQKLMQLKTGLMQALLTGRKRVTSLLNPEPTD